MQPEKWASRPRLTWDTRESTISSHLGFCDAQNAWRGDSSSSPQGTRAAEKLQEGSGFACLSPPGTAPTAQGAELSLGREILLKNHLKNPPVPAQGKQMCSPACSRGSRTGWRCCCQGILLTRPQECCYLVQNPLNFGISADGKVSLCSLSVLFFIPDFLDSTVGVFCSFFVCLFVFNQWLILL